ncbi:hypothetical protein F441_11385 [Phytophthora nicotianae CJ01A1]|uniref:Uncharacterized protein n=1 Tax=Phytophthora nicotianae CJ01A1 TaxID=1317063 RepID=W2WV53_PHYNI|nr:hypothetical protein F441_11385 [Phytophthora nicotianae CJ01A1]
MKRRSEWRKFDPALRKFATAVDLRKSKISELQEQVSGVEDELTEKKRRTFRKYGYCMKTMHYIEDSGYGHGPSSEMCACREPSIGTIVAKTRSAWRGKGVGGSISSSKVNRALSTPGLLPLKIRGVKPSTLNLHF